MNYEDDIPEEAYEAIFGTEIEEITEEEAVQVITNKEPEPEAVEEVAVPTPEPQLQTIQIEEPPVNALKATKTTTTKKATTKKTTTRRKRATKKTTSAD